MKPTDRDALLVLGRDNAEVLEAISVAFARQIFVDGLFNVIRTPEIYLWIGIPSTRCSLDFQGFTKEVPRDSPLGLRRVFSLLQLKMMSPTARGLSDWG